MPWPALMGIFIVPDAGIKGKDTCVESKNSSDCVHCNALIPEQRAQLATPSYKLKKEKREVKKLETDTEHQDTESLVDPSAIPVDGSGTVKSPSLPPEKKPKKDKPKRLPLPLRLLMVRLRN